MVGIIDHTDQAYQWQWKSMMRGKYNGAYYYSREIVKNIIPNVQTDRDWLTINTQWRASNHSIVFIHNNMSAEPYRWLGQYNDLVLVCGIPETCDLVSHLGKPVYLPLSVDVKEVKRFASEKDRDVAFVGRRSKAEGYKFPAGTDFICEQPRNNILAKMARYKKVYAVGRCAIEAKILGCEVLPYDERFPDPSIWKILDNKDAAKMLQKALDEIDGTNYSSK